jgi:adenylate cyclase
VLHGRIAERLERGFADRPRDSAAEMAMHFEQARDARRAVQYHRVAGEVALGRAAYPEAIAHLSRALELVDELPEGVERARLELDVHLALGPAWLVGRSYAAVEVERTYSRALELARTLRETREVGRALRGLWNVHLIRAELVTARKLAAELLTRSKRAREPGLLGLAHAAVGETLFHIGEPTTARAHLERALALGRRAPGVVRTSERPRVMSYLAWALWLGGDPDQARRLCDTAVAEARALERPHNRAFTLGYATIVHELCGDDVRVAELVAEQAAVCVDHELPYFQTWAQLFTGLVRARQGDVMAGVREMRQGVEAHRRTGSVVGVTHLLTLLADLERRAGQTEAGLRTIEDALTLAVKTGNRCVEPEIHRVRGELLVQIDGGGPGSRRAAAEAERAFRRAMAIARRRSARSLELRATTSLARVWQTRGRCAEARRLLAARCRWFAEATDTEDLRTARRLLLALRVGRDALR